MALSNVEWSSVNTTQPLPAASARTFQVTTPPGLDLWKKPPSTIVFTAPIIYKALPLTTLRRARISFTAPWSTLYDQCGIILALPQADSTTQPKFVKAGIEVYDNKPQLSVVAVDRWADWSLGGPLSKDERPVTILLEREETKGSLDTSLWIYHVDKDGVKKPLREVTWLFHDLDEETKCWVGAFCAKPIADSDDPNRSLTMSVEDFELETI